MDTDTKKAMGTNVSRTLNLPSAVFVEEDHYGSPVTLKLKQRHSIITIEDCWRIDDEWWRAKPGSRIYYAVILDSGRRIILCKDLIDNHWYQQTY
jgi:hypothetical protein